MALIGYARVSTDDQKLNLQIDALKAAGCKRIYKDAGVSALAKKRPGFEKALAALKPGDTLVIWRIDRAFRSTIEAINTLSALQERGVDFQCTAMHIDTSTPEGRRWYRDAASWAEYEREIIVERTKAGLAAARRRGVRLGRPFKLTPDEIRLAEERMDRGETLRAVAASYRCKPETLRRHVSLD